MNCSCIFKKEKEAFDLLRGREGFGDKLESVKCANSGIGIDGDLNLKVTLGIPFYVKAGKPGFRTKNGKQMTFLAAFCPFCGASTSSKAKEKADAGSDPIRDLIGIHSKELDESDYAYFELARTRQTGWMAWICSHPKETNPDRKVLAQGQGLTPDEACLEAIKNHRGKKC